MFFLSAPMFGSKHLLGLAFIVILITIVLSIILREKKPNSRKAILSFMIIFYVLEIFKLTYITIENGSYPIYHLPFHLCSLPLYLYPLMYFLKPGAFLDNYVKPAAYSVVLLAGVMALALPTNILGGAISWFPLSENILPIVSFLFHGLMIMSSIYLLKSEYYKFNLKNIFGAIVVSLIFAGSAMLMNLWLDTDFMLLNYGNGSPLQFLIETSKFVYVISMIGLAIFLICLDFVVTELLYTPNQNQNVIKTDK